MGKKALHRDAEDFFLWVNVLGAAGFFFDGGIQILVQTGSV